MELSRKHDEQSALLVFVARFTLRMFGNKQLLFETTHEILFMQMSVQNAVGVPANTPATTEPQPIPMAVVEQTEFTRPF